MVISTNYSAMNAARLLDHSLQAQRKSLARLASGSRIVSPEDDAAGLSQASKQHNEALRTRAAEQTLHNAVSFLQTRDGGLQKIQKAFDRMSELSMLALDSTKTDQDRQNYNKEFQTLFAAIGEIAGTSFNGRGLFRSFQLVTGSFSWSAAKSAAEAAGGHLAAITSSSKLNEIIRDVGEFTSPAWIGLTDEGTEGTFKWITGEPFSYSNWASTPSQQPDNSGDQDFALINWTGNPQYTWNDGGTGDTAGYLVEKGVSINILNDGDAGSFTFTSDVLPSVPTGAIDTIANAAAALTELKTAIASIAKQRAETGAALRRTEFHIEEMQITAENLDAAVSRIADADLAEESTKFARQSILVQSGTAMLAQANLLPQSMLRLLG